jgi:parallel beta-helix repeat protein
MPSKHAKKLRPAGVAVALAFAAAALPAAPASADVTCARVAAPGGSDTAAGTAAAPYATVAKLLSSLNAGEVGCLRSGTYNEDVRVPHGGAAGAPVTLQSYPGERATVVGRFYIPRGSDYVTVAGLNLDGKNGSNLPSPTVNSANATFQDNDVTNDHTQICFDLGNTTWGRASNTVIQRNRIHDCGRIPSTNLDHGIYVSDADNTQILGNVIYDNTDRGIQLYPDAQNTLIRGNVIDGNGEGIIFSGDGGVASNNNVVEYNAITNSTIRNNVESYWPSGNPVGQGNIVRHNCIHGGVRDNGNGGIGSAVGFSLSENLLVDPGYANRAAKDFTLAPDSPCGQLLAGANVSLPTTGTTGSGTSGSGTTSTSGSTDTSSTSSGGTTTVIIKVHRHGKGQLLLLGRIVRRGSVQSAANGGRRVKVQLRWRGAWYPLVSPKVRNGRFHSKVRLPRYLRHRLLKVRATVPSIGRSPTVRFRAA